jgi:hypothetical protein
MAVTAMRGFEAGEASADSISLSGTASYSTSTFRTGARAIRCNPASGANGSISGLIQSTNWRHFGLYIVTAPSIDRVISGLSGSRINVRLTSAPALAIYNDTTLLGTSSTLSTGAWYWIGIRQSTGTSAVFLQVDGADSVTATATVGGISNAELGFTNSEASAAEIFIDDYITDDAGFLAPSKVDTALPISDNTRTAVTGGAGGTTNLWDAVNNTPPAGVASASETDTTNIEYPASLTEDYIANLETYTTLGIGASDTVLAVQSIVRHGEDIATGTKNLQNVGALTNPTVGGSSVTAGSDGGAHGAEVGLWVSTFGTLTTSPSVTLGTSPTIRTSRISESRVACIDFMGMLVAWTPVAAAARIPYSSPYPQLLAH